MTVNDPLSAIEGVVTGLDGLPAYRMVASVFDATTHSYVRAVFTDAAGRYAITGLTPGTYHVRFLSSAGTPVGAYTFFNLKRTISEATTVTASSGATATASMRMTAAPANSAIAGVVTNAGVPLNRIVVTAFGAETHASVKGVFTDSAGRYAITGLPVGSYHVRFTGTTPASLTQYFDHASTHLAGQHGHRQRGRNGDGLKRPRADGGGADQRPSRGTITAGGAGQARVVVGAFNASTGAYVKAVFTDSLGGYRIGGLAAGGYKLRISGTTPSSLLQWYDHATTMSAASVIPLAAGETATVSTDLLGP